MGCYCSKAKREKAYLTSDIGEVEGKQNDTVADKVEQDDEKAPTQTVTATSGADTGQINNLPRPKLDPKDFKFVNFTNEVKIKAPGTINGQCFSIDKCENCDIYILDHTCQVTIDECKGCRILIGPTDGAVFIRDSSNCSLTVVCRQLRTRDCHDCRVALYCRTKPIVESSHNMGFLCSDLNYPALKEHMRLAKLSLLHNFWSDIFDFTPKDGNWELLPADTRAASLMEPIPQEAADLLGATQQGEMSSVEQQSPLLVTQGNRQPQAPAGCTHLFVAFPGSSQEQALQLARQASTQGWLLRTNEVRLSNVLATTLVSEAGWAKAVVKSLATGTAATLGMELAVPEAEAAAIRSQVASLGGHCSESEAVAKTFRFLGVDG